MSIHGLCFDNGMSGKCGDQCEVLHDGDCTVVDEETLDNIVDSDDLDDEQKLDLIDIYGGFGNG